MRGRVILASYFSLCAILVLAMLSLGNNVTVRASLPVRNTSTGLEYNSIQEAINANETLDGHEVEVASGTYLEHVVVNKSISLRGADAATTIVDGEAIWKGTVVNVTGSWGVFTFRFRGFTVKNGENGIALKNCSSWEIKENVLIGNGIGILLDNCSKCIVHDNVITNNGECGIRLINSGFCDIGSRGEGAYTIPNVLTDNGSPYEIGDKIPSGIRLSNSSNCFIGLNNLNNNSRYGIFFDYCDNCLVYAATISNSLVSGVSVNFCNRTNVAAVSSRNNGYGGIDLMYSRSCIVAANTVYNNSVGIDMYECEDCRVEDENSLFYNGDGLSILHSDRMWVVENSFVSNGCGVFLDYTDDSLVLGNRMEDSAWGIAINDGSNCTASYNTVSNASTGFQIGWLRNSKVTENEVANSDIGISVGGQCSNCEVSENNIHNNTVGIHLESDQNTFHRNLLYHNVDQVENMLLNETRKGYNTWDDGEQVGNYWGDYSGFDEDGDAVGEIPYVIDAKNRDYYPLIGSPSDDYRSPVIISCKITNAVSDSNPPLVNPLDVVKVQAVVIDQQTGINQVMLHYGKNELNCSVRMVRVAGDFFNGTYEAWICPWAFLPYDNQGMISGTANMTFQVEAADFVNNVGTSENMTFATVEQRNTLGVDITISQVNTQEGLSVDLDFALNGYLPAWIGDALTIEVENWRGDTKLDAVQLSTPPLLLNGQPTLNYTETLRRRLSLIGQSESYPFDYYYLNLTFRFSPSLPYYLSDPYWSDVHSDAFSLIADNFQKWANVTLSVNMPHYVQQGLVSTWGDPEPTMDYVFGLYNETAGFDIGFVLVRQLNNVLPLLLLIISTTYMLGATLLADARWNPEVKTAIYLSFFVMVAGFNFALRYLIPFRYGLTVAEVLFITLTVATAVFSIGVVISSILFARISEKKAKNANLIIDLSAICLSAVLLAIFSVPIMLLLIEIVGLFFGFMLRIGILDRRAVHQPR